ncbi:hypothetical protein TNCV_1397701 [Trichonephila clavipes]|nr:hypothetical protein TNCV_1397701 [Trichonephila clavipes]
MMHERRFDWIIVCMSEMWKKYGIERKNGTIRSRKVQNRANVRRSSEDRFPGVLGNTAALTTTITCVRRRRKKPDAEDTRHFSSRPFKPPELASFTQQ